MPSTLETQIQAAEQEWLASWKRGPQRLRWILLPLQVGDAAPDFELESSEGQKVRLSDFWRNGPTLLLFWRHYGCSCGMERAKRLQSEYAGYLQAGANVVVVGQGEAPRAAAYAQKQALPCPVLCDPEYRVYEAYDLLEGQPSQIVFDAPDEFLRGDHEAGAKLQESRRGTDRATVDSPWQMPGEFVIDRDGIVRLAYRYQYCEDWPDPLVLVAALKNAGWQRD